MKKFVYYICTEILQNNVSNYQLRCEINTNTTTSCEQVGRARTTEVVILVEAAKVNVTWTGTYEWQYTSFKNVKIMVESKILLMDLEIFSFI